MHFFMWHNINSNCIPVGVSNIPFQPLKYENDGKMKYFMHKIIVQQVDLCDLGVRCSPRDPRFAGSNPAEVDEFFQDVKLLSTSPPGGTISDAVDNLLHGHLLELCV